MVSINSNVTSLTAAPSAKSYTSGLTMFRSSLSFLVLSYILGCVIVALNSVEIHLIRKAWRKITRFEIVLLNLAAADTLTGLAILGITSADTYLHSSSIDHIGFYNSIFYVITLTIGSASTFVIVIGMERSSAIRKPLQHRFTRSSNALMLTYMFVVWVANIIFTIVSGQIDALFTKNLEAESVASKNVGYAMATYFLICIALIVALYLNIGYSILRRRSVFLSFGASQSSSCRRSSMHGRALEAIQKEKATVLVCALVVVSYLICNIPIAVCMCQGRINSIVYLLAAANSALNPLIYFFKSYIERYFGRRNKTACCVEDGNSRRATYSVENSNPSARLHKRASMIDKESKLSIICQSGV